MSDKELFKAIDQPFLFGEDERAASERSLGIMSKGHDVRTVCNVIRRINLMAQHVSGVSELCAEAIFMTKRMSHKLHYYQKDWGKGLWLPEPDPHFTDVKAEEDGA